MHEYQTARAWLADNHQNIDALVLDIDGVLLTGSKPIPGAHEFLDQIATLGIPYRFLTNDACNPLRKKVRALAKGGMTIDESDITSSGHGIADIVEEGNRQGQRFFVAGRLGDPDYGELAGLRCIRDLHAIDSCSGVIIGEGDYLWEDTLNEIVNFYIAHRSAPLIVPNPDWYYSAGDRGIRLASGPVASIIERTLALHGELVKPMYLGKPFEPIFSHNHHELEKSHGSIEKRRVLMIGDSLTSDIAGAAHFGYVTALTLTGISNASMIGSVGETPAIVFRSV